MRINSVRTSWFSSIDKCPSAPTVSSYSSSYPKRQLSNHLIIRGRVRTHPFDHTKAAVIAESQKAHTGYQYAGAFDWVHLTCLAMMLASPR